MPLPLALLQLWGGECCALVRSVTACSINIILSDNIYCQKQNTKIRFWCKTQKLRRDHQSIQTNWGFSQYKNSDYPPRHKTHSALFSTALKPILGNFDFVKMSRLALILSRHVSYCIFNQQQIQFVSNYFCNSN